MIQLLLTAFLAFSSAEASPFKYTLGCSKDGRLTDFALIKNRLICGKFKALNMTCGDSSTSSKQNWLLPLRSPLDTYYSNRDSRSYARGSVAELLNQFAKNDMDPYLTLAIMLVESPPLSKFRNFEYGGRFGQPPMDAQGFLGAVGCGIGKLTVEHKQEIMTKTQLKGSPNAVKILEPSGEDAFRVDETIRTWETSGPKKRVRLQLVGGTELVTVQVSQMTVADPIKMEPDSGQCSTKCCFEVVAPPGKSLEQLQDAIVQKASAKFMANIMSRGKRKGGPDRFAFVLQGYNGYGTFGVSERMANSCLIGMNMRNTPLYGAGVSELMLNSLMANSEVAKLVAAASKEAGLSAPRSYLCSMLGAGSHQIDGDAFANLQARFLRSRRGCGNHSFTFKTSDPIGAEATKAAQ